MSTSPSGFRNVVRFPKQWETCSLAEKSWASWTVSNDRHTLVTAHSMPPAFQISIPWPCLFSNKHQYRQSFSIWTLLIFWIRKSLILGQGCPMHGSISGLYPTDANSNLPSHGNKCLQILANVSWGQNTLSWKPWPRINGERASEDKPKSNKRMEGGEGRQDTRERGRERGRAGRSGGISKDIDLPHFCHWWLISLTKGTHFHLLFIPSEKLVLRSHGGSVSLSTSSFFIITTFPDKSLLLSKPHCPACKSKASEKTISKLSPNSAYV